MNSDDVCGRTGIEPVMVAALRFDQDSYIGKRN